MSHPHRLYVGTIGEGLWRSTDGGTTFARACDGMFMECHVRALAVHPRNPHTLFLGCELGLFRSNDAAANWSRVESPINGLQVWSIAISRLDPNLIVVGTCPSRLFRTEDGGKTWSEPAVNIVRECPRIVHTRVTTLMFDPSEPETVWAGVEIDGLFRSKDGGVTWQALGQGLSSRDIHGLAIVPGIDKPKRFPPALTTISTPAPTMAKPGSRRISASRCRGRIAGDWHSYRAGRKWSFSATATARPARPA